MKRPLVILTVIFCAGIALAGKIRVSFLLAYSLAAALLISSIFSVNKKIKFDVFLSFLTLCLGAILFLEHEVLPRNHISFLLPYRYKNEDWLVKGVIDNQPQSKNNRVFFVFKLEELQYEGMRYKTSGRMLVHVTGVKGLTYGEEIILTGDLKRPFSFGGENRVNYGDYLRNQGIHYIMRVKIPGRVVRLNKNRGLALKRLALRLKVKVEEMISRHLSYTARGILDAMVLGEKKGIPKFVYDSMKKSGTLHILVVSGFNVGLVAFMISVFLRLIRIPKALRFYIATLLLVIYCFMTGASTPVVRATLMAVFFMFACLIRREPDIYNSIASAAISILVFDPRQLFDAGFQLSFVSVVSIIHLYPKIKSFLCLEAISFKPARFLFDGCLVSFFAWAGTAGFIAYYFKMFSPITVLANMFIVPLASMITLCGFSLIAVELLFPAAACFFAYSCEFIAMLLVVISSLLIKLPGAYVNLAR